ncbi:cysteine proteinase [Daldinia eschscholtzii]|nr:cysteine proteinase [Daldinia eschscholtzii]
MEYKANADTNTTNAVPCTLDVRFHDPRVNILPSTITNHNGENYGLNQSVTSELDRGKDTCSPEPIQQSAVESSTQHCKESKGNLLEIIKEKEVYQNKKDVDDKSKVSPIHLVPHINDPVLHVGVNSPTKAPVNKQASLGIDLRKYLSEAYNQLRMSSCVAHAVAGAFEFAVRKGGIPDFSPSRLYIWYYARLNDKSSGDPNGGIKYNVGVYVRKALMVLSSGVCSENHWSYEYSTSDPKTRKFAPGAKAAAEPDKYARRNARQYTATYIEIGSKNLHDNLIQCLDSGFPFIFSMNTYGRFGEGFNEKNGYTIKSPKPTKIEPEENYHALLAVGYIPGDTPQSGLFIIRNSWGTGWGDRGHFYMPYSYMSQSCWNFWTVRVRTAPKRRHNDGEDNAQNPSKHQRLITSGLDNLKIT